MSIDHGTGLSADMGVTADMMARPDTRLPLIDPDDIPADIRPELGPAFEWSKRMWGTVPRYFQLLGHAPGAVEGWLVLDQKLRVDYLNKDPGYVKLQELLIVKTALLNECNNCVGHNVELGRSLGLTDEQIDLLAGEAWRDSDLFSEKEKTVIWWAEEVTTLRAKRNRVLWEAMQEHFTPRQIMELTMLCGMWNLSGRVAEALHLVVEPPGKRISFQK